MSNAVMAVAVAGANWDTHARVKASVYENVIARFSKVRLSMKCAAGNWAGLCKALADTGFSDSR
ncbi:hypothetical protein [Cupriavidus necator]|uniref:hypothetical protein n=1 Tax=Cupriavidus necator TaxID=106590 RepID=UPI0002EDC34C